VYHKSVRRKGVRDQLTGEIYELRVESDIDIDVGLGAGASFAKVVGIMAAFDLGGVAAGRGGFASDRVAPAGDYK
jgi:hypothetical protein